MYDDWDDDDGGWSGRQTVKSVDLRSWGEVEGLLLTDWMTMTDERGDTYVRGCARCVCVMVGSFRAARCRAEIRMDTDTHILK